ncbi:hypothetical protein [Ralstonia phage RP31]|uniref:Uncharacterized protein n=2 Tax=Ripduovirus RP12 TaxID=2560700 RepID=A0A1L7N0Z4_9CAUD|nr:hypothetical protein FDH28_gp246 [Ralstonia phage RP12]BAW19149.1 hypothetical protein [Ralstonia phage RP12]BAW19435.1 hypothetical protein [Ralstonia phage RP31]
MTNHQDVAGVVMETAAKHMHQTVMAARHGAGTVLTSIYYITFKELLEKCEITPEEKEQRIREFADTHYPKRSQQAVTSNLLKAADDKNMSVSTFSKLIAAVFPAKG